MNTVVIVAHKFLPQMDDELVRDLNGKKYPHVLHIYHSFSDAKDRKSFYKHYENGVLTEEGVTSDYSYLPEPLLYLKELWFTLFWILKTGRVWEVFIGMDGLCTNFGLLLKLLGLARKVIYWAVDFVPEKRFSAGWKNKTYHLINTHGYKHADELWDLSPRMKEARKEYLGVDEHDYKKIQIVPYGMWTERIKHVPFEKCEKNTLVFMGHLLPKQGVQLIVNALPFIKKKIPNIKLKIVGTGSYENELKKLVKDLKLEKECQFLGKIESMQEMESEIAKSAIALAPYISSLDTWTYYADPGKVKTYLACGVPVLMTNIPWNAQEIEKQNCGFIIDETEEDIVKKVLVLLDPKINETYRKNAIKYSQSYNYHDIFEKLDL